MRPSRFLVCLLVLSLFSISIEAKKKSRWNNQRRLRRLCRKQTNSSQENSALELHAFFDLRPKHKKDRKIEPIYDSSLNGWNGDKYKVLSKYVQNQPAIYRMCLDATIYRFVSNSNNTKKNSTSNNNHVKRAINSSAHSPPNVTRPTLSTPIKGSSNGIDPISLCPVFAKKKHQRRPNFTPMRFMFCQGQHCPCMRICVGQGRNRTNFHDCSTFRIICTFNCSSDSKTTVTPTASNNPRGSAKSTPRKHRTGKTRKSRGHKKKKSQKGKRRRPRRKPKSKKGKKNGRKQTKKVKASKNNDKI